MVNAGYLEVNGDTSESLSACSPFWVPRFCVLTHNSRLYYFQSREHVPKHEGVLSLGRVCVNTKASVAVYVAMDTDRQLSPCHQLVPADPDIVYSFMTICSAVM